MLSRVSSVRVLERGMCLYEFRRLTPTGTHLTHPRNPTGKIEKPIVSCRLQPTVPFSRKAEGRHMGCCASASLALDPVEDSHGFRAYGWPAYWIESLNYTVRNLGKIAGPFYTVRPTLRILGFRILSSRLATRFPLIGQRCTRQQP